MADTAVFRRKASWVVAGLLVLVFSVGMVIADGEHQEALGNVGKAPGSSVPGVAPASDTVLKATADLPLPMQRDSTDASLRVDTTPETTSQRSRRWLASTPYPSGDIGIDALVRTVRNALDPAPGAQDPWQSSGPFPAAAEAAADRENNPLGIELNSEDVAQLDSMIQEGRMRIRDLVRDTFLEHKLALVAAIERGDFRIVPNGKWPEGLKEELNKYAKERAGKDFNTANAPGHDLTHNRFMVLDRTVAPRWFETRDQQRRAEAELKIAIRSFFLRGR